MADLVRITDVSPRDGLQNEPGNIPTSNKLELIRLLCHSDVDQIEITSFVSPKWVPQLADAAAIVEGVRDIAVQDFKGSPPNRYIALIPNAKGLEALHAAESSAIRHRIEQFQPPIVSTIALFAAASETFSQKNINATIEESFERFRQVTRVPRSSPGIRGYVSCVIACPFEGPIKPQAVADVAARFADLGVTEIDLGDTIGAGTPETILEMLEAVERRIGRTWLDRGALVLHLHDTFGRAADCVKAALDFGVRSFDGSVAGLGGCPYASTPGKRAPGNISTELLVRTIEGAGFRTSVDKNRLAIAADYARTIVVASCAESSGGPAQNNGGGQP